MGLAGRVRSKMPDLGKNFDRGRHTILLGSCLYDIQEFTLKRSMMPFGALPQALHHRTVSAWVVGSIGRLARLDGRSCC